MKTASNWLLSLPEYNCDYCSNKTIFKGGECTDCQQLHDARRERVELQDDYNTILSEITYYRKRLLKKEEQIQANRQWLKENDKDFKE